MNPERLSKWADSIHRYNRVVLYIVVAVTGSVGLVSAWANGRVAFWLLFGLAIGVLVVAFRLGWRGAEGLSGMGVPSAQTTVMVTLVLFCNEFFFLWPMEYLLALKFTLLLRGVPSVLRFIAYPPPWGPRET